MQYYCTWYKFPNPVPEGAISTKNVIFPIQGAQFWLKMFYFQPRRQDFDQICPIYNPGGTILIKNVILPTPVAVHINTENNRKLPKTTEIYWKQPKTLQQLTRKQQKSPENITVSQLKYRKEQKSTEKNKKVPKTTKKYRKQQNSSENNRKYWKNYNNCTGSNRKVPKTLQ